MCTLSAHKNTLINIIYVYSGFGILAHITQATATAAAAVAAAGAVAASTPTDKRNQMSCLIHCKRAGVRTQTNERETEPGWSMWTAVCLNFSFSLSLIVKRNCAYGLAKVWERDREREKERELYCTPKK